MYQSAPLSSTARAIPARCPPHSWIQWMPGHTSRRQPAPVRAVGLGAAVVVAVSLPDSFMRASLHALPPAATSPPGTTSRPTGTVQP